MRDREDVSSERGCAGEVEKDQIDEEMWRTEVPAFNGAKVRGVSEVD